MRIWASYLRVIAVLVAAFYLFLTRLIPESSESQLQVELEGQSSFVEKRSTVTYTVECPEQLSAILRKTSLSLSAEAVARLNPHLKISQDLGRATSFPQGTKLKLFIQAERQR